MQINIVDSIMLLLPVLTVDTTMMFVLIGLGLYKLYECRNPDNVPHTHWLLFILSLLILLIGVGVVSNISINIV